MDLTNICYRNYILHTREMKQTTEHHVLEHLAMARHNVPLSNVGLLYSMDRDYNYRPIHSFDCNPKNPALALFSQLQSTDRAKIPLALATLLESDVVFLDILDTAFSHSDVNKMLDLDPNLRYQIDYGYSLSGKK